MPKWTWAVAAALGLAVPAPAADDEVSRSIAALTSVAREGKSNDAAGPAWKELVARGVPALLPTLAAIDDGNPTAANWLRTAAGAIAEAEATAGRKVPADRLEAFAKDVKNAPSARQLAYELLAAQDAAAPDRLLPGFLNDPNTDLRRAAVAAELGKLDKTAGPTAKAGLEKLFATARDPEQVEAIAKKLEPLGAKVSVTEHLAFVTHWQLVGPFPSSKGKALTLADPPATATAATGTFKGKGDADVTWKPYQTTDKLGTVDLNKVVGADHDAAVYALAVVKSDAETPCEVRVATANAVQIFLNGKKLFEREEYHHGVNLDHHVGKGTLKAGQNVLVLKIAQNNQTDKWAQTWGFQARVSDATGGPLPGLTQVADGKPVKLGYIPAAASKEDKK